MEKLSFNIEWKSLFRIGIFILAAILIYLARSEILALLIAITLSLGLDPIIDWLEKKGIPRILAVIFLLIALITIVATTVYLIIPIIFSELKIIIAQLQTPIEKMFGINIKTINFLQFTQLINEKINLQSSNWDLILNISHKTILTIATIMMTFYLMLTKNGLENFLKDILPNSVERKYLIIFHSFSNKIRKWLLSQIILSITIGIVTGIGVWIIGVPYPLLIGFIAALFEIIPFIGPIMVGAIAFIIAMTQSFILGIYTIVLFIIIHQLENHIFAPLILGKTMKIHPVIVVFSLLAGANIAGIAGIILSVPATVLIQEIINDFSNRKKIHQNLGF
ncbi:MAG: AI-2E family transporter [Minisyncoccia bacterium]